MAITSFSGSNYLNRTTNLLNYNAAYTWMAWLYATSAASGVFWGIKGSSGSTIDYEYFGFFGGNYDLFISGAIAGESTANPAFAGTNQWVHFAVVRLSNSAIQCYQNGSTITSPASLGISARPSAAVSNIGYFVTDTPIGAFSGRIFNAFEYDVALTQAEIQQQMYRHLPQRTANLRAWFPMFADSSRNLDFSGNGRDYSEVGTLTNADGLLIPVSPLLLPKSRSVAPPPPYYASPSMLMAC